MANTSLAQHSRAWRNGVAAAAFGALAFAVGPARTASGEIATGAPANEAGTEVQRFCSNIADAARDRRYAMQAKELERLKAEIDDRIKVLESKRLDYEQWLKRRDDFLSKAEDNVVKIYAKMKPDAAAERLAEVKIDLAAGILMKLDPRQASTILNEMDSTAAATITGVMASATRKEDPS